MIDSNFPILEYEKGGSHMDWGQIHGETHRSSIKELFEIRKELMLKRNPGLKNNLDELAKGQYEVSKSFSPELSEEMKGISLGANLSLTDIIILNNYTDFRDILLEEEGCSTVHLNNTPENISGQTWDMHSSAKNYLCVIKVPGKNGEGSQLILSLLGCLGLSGLNSNNLFIGVNNLNTKNAEIGLIWPLLIRKCLESNNFSELENHLTTAPITSGHSYLISSPQEGRLWEIAPAEKELVGICNKSEKKNIFHTNHCVGEKMLPLEDLNFKSKTTDARFKILEEKIDTIQNMEQLESLLKGHENFPSSLCSHFKTQGSSDPAQTCGGILTNMTNGKTQLWRGCQEYDKNYKSYNFSLVNGQFIQEKI